MQEYVVYVFLFSAVCALLIAPAQFWALSRFIKVLKKDYSILYTSLGEPKIYKNNIKLLYAILFDREGQFDQLGLQEEQKKNRILLLLYVFFALIAVTSMAIILVSHNN